MAANRYQQRTYRDRMVNGPLPAFQVVVGETDLFVHCPEMLADQVQGIVVQQRAYIESFIRQHPDFACTLQPMADPGPAPLIIRNMIRAGKAAGVGPMAAVAGAVAEAVGLELLKQTDEIVIENGGDIFLQILSPITVGIFAGDSPLSMKIGLRVYSSGQPIGICTSSGTIGHSLSLGKADAVCVLSSDCSLADAAATSIGNRVCCVADIPRAIEFGQAINGVTGLVVILGSEIGAWGAVELVPLTGKKG